MKIILLLSFFYLFSSVSAQNLTLFTEANHGGSVTYLDLEFLNENLFVSGWHRDSGVGIIWKHDGSGNLLDSVVYHDTVSIYLLKKEDNFLLAYSRDRRNDSIFIAIRKIDGNLSLIWKKEYNIGTNWTIKKLRVFPFKGTNYVFIHYLFRGASFLKLDDEFNLEKFEHNQNMTIYAYDPVDYVDSGFVFSTDRSHVIIDTSFNVSGQTVYPYNPLIGGTPFGELIEIDDDKRWYCGQYGEFNEGRKYSLMHFKDNYQTLTVYPYFGSYGENSSFGNLRSLAPNKDTSIIYATGLQRDPYPNQPAPFGSYEAYPFWVARLNADSIVWYQFYNDGNYYYPINMEVGDDNCLYLACTRYEVDLQPSYSESVIFKIEPGAVGIIDKPQEVAISVYPNPGKDQITIESGNFTGVFTMYNLHGQIIVTQELNERATINTTNIAQGIYFYRFVNSRGETASGKWVKE